jgi:hypothetical protein
MMNRSMQAKSGGRGTSTGLGFGIAGWYGVRNRRHIAHERGPGSPWQGHLIVLCEVTADVFAWRPGSVLWPSAVQISERHST